MFNDKDGLYTMLKRMLLHGIIFLLALQLAVPAGTANASGNDAVAVKLEEGDAKLTFLGDWTQRAGTGYSGGQAKFTQDPGASLAFRFVGTGFKLFGSTGQELGSFQVEIDGGSAKTVNPSSAKKDKQTIYDSRTLKYAEHEVVVRPVGATAALNVDYVELTALRPPSPSSVRASYADDAVTVGWTAVSGVKGYNVYRTGRDGAAVRLNDEPLSGLELTQYLGGVHRSSASTYTYRVTSVGEAGLESTDNRSAAVTVPSNAATAPKSVRASADEAGSVGLTWQASALAEGYKVLRAASKNGPFEVVSGEGLLFGTSFSDKPKSDTFSSATLTFYYRVAAVNRYQIESEASQAVSVQVKPDRSPQSFAGRWTGDAVELQWNAVTGASGYKLRKYDGSSKKWIEYASLNGSSTTYSEIWNGRPLSGNLTEKYSVAAVDGYGNESAQATTSVTIPKNTAEAPNRLQSLNDHNAVTLYWQPATNAVGYYIDRGADRNGPWTRLNADAPIEALSFVDEQFATIVAPVNSKYYYRVTAVNRYGTPSNYAAYSSVVKKAPDAPLTFSAAYADEKIVLNWTLNADAVDVRVVEYNGPATTVLYEGLADRMQYVYELPLVDRTGDTTRTYGIQAIDRVGNFSRTVKTTVKVPKTKPAKPTSVHAAADERQVDLTWAPADHSVGYRVFRWNTSSSAWQLIGQTENTSFSDTHFAGEIRKSASSIYYAVSAVGKYGIESVKSGRTAVTVPATSGPDWQIAAFDSGSQHVMLSWAANPAAASYRVERAEGKEGAYVLAGTSAEPSFEDTITERSYSDEIVYRYRVVAVGSNGTSSLPSQPATVTVPSNAPTAPTALQAELASDRVVRLQWAASANAEGYLVYGSEGGNPFSLISGEVPVAGTAFEYAPPNRGDIQTVTSFSFAVRAVNRYGAESELSSPAGVAIAPPASPTALTAQAQPSAVSLAWQPADGAAGYRVYRSLLSPQEGYELTGSVTSVTYGFLDASFQSVNIAIDTPAYYRVVSIDAGGYESLPTAYATAVIPRNDAVQVTGLNAIADDRQSVLLQWQASERAATYAVIAVDADGAERTVGTTANTELEDVYWRTVAITSPVAVSYKVVAYNAFGLPAAPSESVSVVLLPVSEPIGVTIAYADGQVVLTWEATDRAIGYNVYRASSVDEPYALLTAAPIVGTSFEDDWRFTVAQDSQPAYAVEAVGNNGARSAQVFAGSVTIPANIAESPAAPEVVLNDGQAYLTWPRAANAVGYIVYRSVNGQAPTPLNGGAAVDRPAYVDDTVRQLQAVGEMVRVRYAISAVNAYGAESAMSSATVAELPPLLAKPVVSLSYESGIINVDWTAVEGAVSYQLYRLEAPSGEWTKIAETDADKQGYSDAVANRTRTETQLYRYQVVATGDSNSSTSDAAEIAAAPNAAATPSQPAATLEGMLVTLQWGAADNAVGYNIYRAKAGTTGYSLLTSVPIAELSFQDQSFAASPAASTAQYEYAITAVNQYGIESGLSQAVQVTIAPLALSAIEDNRLTDVKLTGKWTQWNREGMSGGSASYSYANDAAAQMSFFGSIVEYVGYKNAYGGMVNIEIDGRTVASVDTYAETEQFGATLYTARLNEGQHTIKLKRSSQRNPASLGSNIPFDALRIDGHAVRRIEETHGSLIKKGNYLPVSDASYPNNKGMYTFDADSSVTVPFYGTAIDWVGFTSPWNGIVDVYLDGALLQSVDTYGPSIESEKRLVSLTGLTKSLHTLKLVRSGNKNPAASGTNLSFDYFLIDGSPSQIIENDAASITYGLSWNAIAGANHSGGTSKYTWELNGTAEVVFYGSEIAWYGFKNEFGGMADILIDNQVVATVDTYSASATFKEKLYGATGLEKGVHTFKIKRIAAKNPASKGTNVPLDYLQTDGKFGTVLDQNASNAAYTGSWTSLAGSVYYKQSALYTWQTNAAADISFQGTGIAIIGFKNGYGGLQKFQIDGMNAGITDTYAVSAKYNQTLIELTDLPTGTHILKITGAGKSANSSGSNINIDAIVVFD